MIWLNAFGVGCIGAVCGYILFYTLKRLNTADSGVPFPVGEVVTMLAAVGAGGAINGIYKTIDGANYIGSYGIGLLVGFSINIALTIYHEDPFQFRSNTTSKSTKDEE